MTGALVLPAGLVGTPSLAFTGDVDNGLYYIGTNNWAAVTNGAAILTFSATAITAAKGLTTVASATGGAGFNLPPGTAPTSPVNGDLWLTTTAILARIGGVTVTLGASAGAGLLSTNNLSDVGSVATSRTNLGVTATGADTAYSFRANNLSDLANAGTARTNLGLTAAATTAIGTSGATIPLLSTANTWTLAQTFSAAAVFSVAPTFTDASGTRTALGLGTSATVNTGTSGATVLLANGNNTYGGTAQFSSTLGVTGATTLSSTLGLAGVLTATAGAQTTPSAVTFNATTMTLNCALSNVFTTTFTANVTSAPTVSNPGDGQTINWFITQDGTGTRTMTWPTSFKWPGGVAGVLSTPINSVDLLVATFRSSTGFWYATLAKAFA